MGIKKLKIFLLTIALIFNGCVTMTPSQEQWYAKYVLDSNKPQLNTESKSVVGAAILSILIPGIGELYLNQPKWAAVWYFVGMVLPLTAPAVAAADAQTVNKILLGEQYHQYIVKKEQEQEGKREKRFTCSFCGWTGEDQLFCPGCGHRH